MRGAVLMLAAMVCFSAMGVFIRLSSEHVHILETVFFRNFLALLFMLPWILRQGPEVLRTRRIGLYISRSAINIVGMTGGFMAIMLIPLAEATALSFTTPLFATLGAALFLGETMRGRRMTALAIGFLGMLVVLRPGAEAISLGAMLALGHAVAIAATILIVKRLTTTERPETIVIYMVLLQSPVSLVPALFVWEWPSAEAWLWLACLAGFATAGHLFFTRALQLAEVSQLQPLDFVRLPMIGFLGYVLFDEQPTVWTWLGGAVIFASTAYVTHREAQLERERRLTGA